MFEPMVRDVIAPYVDALKKLNQDGITPIAIICVIDRQTGDYENLRSAGHDLLSVLTMEDIESAL